MLVASPPTDSVTRFGVRVRGEVQGVGFRPFVYRLARELALSGWVRNDGAGVVIEVQGTASGIDRFIQRLSADAPRLARVESVEIRSIRSVHPQRTSPLWRARAARLPLLFPPTPRCARTACASFSTRAIGAIVTRSSTARSAVRAIRLPAPCPTIAHKRACRDSCSVRLPRRIHFARGPALPCRAECLSAVWAAARSRRADWAGDRGRPDCGDKLVSVNLGRGFLRDRRNSNCHTDTLLIFPPLV